MFLGYQTNVKNNEQFIALVAETREELEQNEFMRFDRIEESSENYTLIDGVYLTDSELKTKHEQSARAKRDALLNETDFLLMPDYPLPPEDKAAIVEYRTLLREVPQQAGFPDKIDWPVMPAVLKK